MRATLDAHGFKKVTIVRDHQMVFADRIQERCAAGVDDRHRIGKRDVAHVSSPAHVDIRRRLFLPPLVIRMGACSAVEIESFRGDGRE